VKDLNPLGKKILRYAQNDNGFQWGVLQEALWLRISSPFGKKVSPATRENVYDSKGGMNPFAA
jgi:hypothetical protein